MSDDIVERLRRWVDREIAESDPAGAITAAADEIERMFLLVGSAADKISDLQNENIRLRAICGLAPKQPIQEIMW